MFDHRTPAYQQSYDYNESPRRTGDYMTPYETAPYPYNYPPVYTSNRFLPLQDTHEGSMGYQRPHSNYEYHGPDNHSSKDFHWGGKGQKRPSDPREATGEAGDIKGKKRKV